MHDLQTLHDIDIRFSTVPESWNEDSCDLKGDF